MAFVKFKGNIIPEIPDKALVMCGSQGYCLWNCTQSVLLFLTVLKCSCGVFWLVMLV